MSIQSEISRITGLRDDSFDEVRAKGGTIPSGATLDDLPSAIRAIPTPAFITYYTGSGAPSSSLGSDGDIYLQTGN